MKKKINYDYLRTCINGFEFAIDWYNYWARENNYPEITIDDLIKFLKQEKKKKLNQKELTMAKSKEFIMKFGQMDAIQA